MKFKTTICVLLIATGLAGLLCNGFALIYMGAIKPMSDFTQIQMIKTLANLIQTATIFLAAIAISLIPTKGD